MHLMIINRFTFFSFLQNFVLYFSVATRRTYERYLIKLQTGQALTPSNFEPADDEDEDEDTGKMDGIAK